MSNFPPEMLFAKLKLLGRMFAFSTTYEALKTGTSSGGLKQAQAVAVCILAQPSVSAALARVWRENGDLPLRTIQAARGEPGAPNRHTRLEPKPDSILGFGFPTVHSRISKFQGVRSTESHSRVLDEWRERSCASLWPEAGPVPLGIGAANSKRSGALLPGFEFIYSFIIGDLR